MFAAERHKKIKQVLSEYNKVTVSGLSELLSVSEVTVRKDLEALENEGYLIRTHGGAILNQDNHSLEKDESSDIDNLEQKKTIGLYAAEMIENNEAIYIGSGTTCLEIARNIKNVKDLTVITNNISAALLMGKNDSIKVILTSGYLKVTNVYTLTGIQVVDSLRTVYVDKAFISVKGIDIKRGYTVSNPEDAMIAKSLINCSNELIIAADSSKFGKIDFTPVGHLKIAHKIISDQATPEEYIKFCFENNIQLYTTYNINRL